MRSTLAAVRRSDGVSSHGVGVSVKVDVRYFSKRQLGPDECHDIAVLHRELLPHSPVVLLGPGFMERFYYPVLSTDGLICGAIAYLDSVPAGFIVATHDSDGFMSDAVRRHFIRLIWVMGTSVLRNPRRIVAIRDAYMIQRGVSQAVADRDGQVGELLSFGVLDRYRSAKFVRSTGIRLSQHLFDAAIVVLKSRGVRRIRSVVDQDNIETKIFYSANGWTIGHSDVPGWGVPSMEFELDLTTSDRDGQ